MKRHLFLSGPAGCGKSRLIKEVLGSRLQLAGGFMTRPEYSEEGRYIGVELVPAAAAGGVEGLRAMSFLDMRKNPPDRDNEVFRSYAVQLLQEAEYYPFAVIDEIGGFEMVIPQFRIQLSETLSSGLPIIGVLKDSVGAERLRRRFGLGNRYNQLADRLNETLADDPDTLIIQMKGPDDPDAREAVARWAEQYAAL